MADGALNRHELVGVVQRSFQGRLVLLKSDSFESERLLLWLVEHG